MKIDSIHIEKASNGVIVTYWEDGEEVRRLFTSKAKLITFLKDQIDMK